MSAVKSLIDASMSLEATALLGENARVASRSLDFSKTKARKRGANTKDLVRLGLTNVVGLGLIRAQGELAQGL